MKAVSASVRVESSLGALQVLDYPGMVGLGAQARGQETHLALIVRCTPAQLAARLRLLADGLDGGLDGGARAKVG